MFEVFEEVVNGGAGKFAVFGDCGGGVLADFEKSEVDFGFFVAEMELAQELSEHLTEVVDSLFSLIKRVCWSFCKEKFDLCRRCGRISGVI